MCGNLPLPHLRLFLHAFVTLLAGFSLGSRLPQKRFLGGDAKHLLALRLDGQHRLQQVALMMGASDRT